MCLLVTLMVAAAEKSRPKPLIQPQSSTKATPCAMPCGRLKQTMPPLPSIRREDAMMISDPHVVVLGIAFYHVIPVVGQISRILRFFRGTFCLSRGRALSPRFVPPIFPGCGLDVATGQ